MSFDATINAKEHVAAYGMECPDANQYIENFRRRHNAMPEKMMHVEIIKALILAEKVCCSFTVVGCIHVLTFHPPQQDRAEYDAKMFNIQQKLDHATAAYNARISAMDEERYINNAAHGETKVDFFKRKYYEQMVMDPTTGEPAVCILSGEAISKAHKYNKELVRVSNELDLAKEQMTSAESIVHLKRVQLKARQFKRKYAYAKKILRDEFKTTAIDDKFCESDKNCGDDADESDEDLRSSGPRRTVVVQQDIGLPFGFMAVEMEEA
jgi:hypothetical protein